MDVFKSTSAERQEGGIHVVCTTTPSSSAASRPIDHSVNYTVASRESVRDLGVYLDSDMSMHKHVTQLACSCYGVLRQLRSVVVVGSKEIREVNWSFSISSEE